MNHTPTIEDLRPGDYRVWKVDPFGQVYGPMPVNRDEWGSGSELRPCGMLHAATPRIVCAGCDAARYDAIRVRRQFERNKKAIRADIFKRDGYRCLACGTEDDLTVDHIRPTSKRGGNAYSNLQTLCHPCNTLKGAKY